MIHCFDPAGYATHGPAADLYDHRRTEVAWSHQRPSDQTTKHRTVRDEFITSEVM